MTSNQNKCFKITNKRIIIICLSLIFTGCTSFGYYLDLMAGHSELMEQQQPITELLEAKETKPQLRKLLRTSQNMRNFASKNLYLPENDSYRWYADIKRPYAVWNVVAAKEFSTKAKTWCFLIVGCLSYRGYFSKADATEYAKTLKEEGYDVYVVGAKAYSTLGWFDDPLLNTMMYKSEAHRAGIIFHELAHQVVYIDDDSAFNEAFATSVEQEGIKRWFERKAESSKYVKYLKGKQRDNQINLLLRETRNNLARLYKSNKNSSYKRELKKKIFSDMITKYEVLKKSWAGYSGFDKWIYQGLNNAHLLLVATYHDLVPAFNFILKQQDYNLKKFYDVVTEIGELEKEQRKVQLKQNEKIAKIINNQ